MSQEPKVYLVGAGPGDPELLTVKAMRLIAAEADVVVYDRLVSEDIMDFVPPGTARIFVGKATNRHTLPQDEINDLLVRLAKSGRTVVRLKGGDPYVFGRGGEEAEFLRANGVAFEVVPGITAGSGCAAYAGIPLTHRGLATSVRYITGHCRAGVDLDLNWDSLADPDTTLVVYMGLAHLPEISAKLIAAGLPADTPAAAIANGTTREQQTCVTTLAGLPRATTESGLRAPVMVIIGKVVDMAAVLAGTDAGLGAESNREQFGAD